MGFDQREGEQMLGLLMRSRLSRSLWFVPSSRRIRSRVRSSNNSNHASPRLVRNGSGF